MPAVKKEYLGDGAYATFDGYALWITTSDGLRITNKICLEPEVLRDLVKYIKKVAETNDNSYRMLSSLMLLYDPKNAGLY